MHQDSKYALSGSLNILTRKIPIKEWFVLITIRYLYLATTILALDGVWYRGYGSYGINFNVEKEFIASIVFIIISLIYVLKMKEKSSRGTLIHAIFILYLIPLNCSFGVNNATFDYFFLSTAYSLVLILCLTIAPKTDFHSPVAHHQKRWPDTILRGRIIKI